MKKYFTGGLALLLPLLLTFMILNFLISFITQPFLNITQNFFEKFVVFDQSFLAYHQETILLVFCKIIILVFLAALTILVGVFGKLFLIDIIFRFGDYLFHKVPLINKIYRACKDVVHSLFSSTSNKFTQVVFVPFPSPHNLSIGLVASQAVKVMHHDSELFSSVFVPGTPNPSVGFMLMFRKDQLIYVDMKVEEAMKFIISCGVVMPEFKIIQPRDNHEEQFQSDNHFSSDQEQRCEDSTDLCKSPGSL